MRKNLETDIFSSTLQTVVDNINQHLGILITTADVDQMKAEGEKKLTKTFTEKLKRLWRCMFDVKAKAGQRRANLRLT